MNNKLPEPNPIKGYMNCLEYLKKDSAGNKKDVESDIKWANERFMRFPEYVLAVCKTMLKSPYDPNEDREDYINDVEQRDKERSMVHDLAIDSCAIFNRMCDEAGIPRFCPDIPEDKSQTDRKLVGEFAHYVTAFVFNQNAGYANDDKIKVMREHFENIK